MTHTPLLDRFVAILGLRAGETASRRTAFFTALLAGFVALYYAGAIALWFGGSGIFTFSHLDYIQGIEPVERATLHHPYTRLPLPFFDLAGVLSWRECRLLGFNVELHNPCDPNGRLANYSPLLPQLPLEWIGMRNILPAGFVLDGAFLLVLLFVLRPGSWQEFSVSALAAVSPTTFFAVERANIDILIFLLLMGAMLLPQRQRWARLVSCAAAFIGFLTKFYPVIFFVAMLRERLRLLLPLSFALLVALTIFFLGYRADLARISAILPLEVIDYEMFGGRIFPQSVQTYFHLPHGASTLIYLGCCATSLWCAIGIGERIGDGNAGAGLAGTKNGPVAVRRRHSCGLFFFRLQRFLSGASFFSPHCPECSPFVARPEFRPSGRCWDSVLLRRLSACMAT